jgi:hypothetical protein
MSGDHNQHQKPQSHAQDEEPVIWVNDLRFDRSTKFFSHKQQEGDIPLFTTPFAWRSIRPFCIFTIARKRLTRFEDVWLGTDANVCEFAIDLDNTLKEINYG